MGRNSVLFPFFCLILLSFLSSCLQSGNVSKASRSGITVTSSSSSSSVSSSSSSLRPPSEELLESAYDISSQTALVAASNKLVASDIRTHNFPATVAVDDVQGEITVSRIHPKLKQAIVEELEELNVLDQVDQITNTKYRLYFKPGINVGRYLSYLKNTLLQDANAKYSLTGEATARIEAAAAAKRQAEINAANAAADAAKKEALLLAATKTVYRYYYKASQSYLHSFDAERTINKTLGDNRVTVFKAYSADTKPSGVVPVYLHQHTKNKYYRLSRLASIDDSWTKKSVVLYAFSSANQTSRYEVVELYKDVFNNKKEFVTRQFVYVPRFGNSIQERTDLGWHKLGTAFWVPK